jgi:16S rRNA (uracil1498-N3)-methyltransferase
VTRPHFFAGAPAPGETVVLEPEDAHHAIRSLRLRAGDEFTSSDGRGAVARCRVTRATRLLVEGEVEERTDEPPPRPALAVLLAAPKGDRLAWGVQKLTEIGADRIVVVHTPRSVRRWEGERAARVADRLGGVAREAAKQSRRRTIPEVAGPVPWDRALREALGRGPVAVLWEGADRGLSEVLPDDRPEALALAVGPEGGIEEADARAAEERGAVLASLGPNILRTETAAVAASAVALARYGRLG